MPIFRGEVSPDERRPIPQEETVTTVGLPHHSSTGKALYLATSLFNTQTTDDICTSTIGRIALEGKSKEKLIGEPQTAMCIICYATFTITLEE